MVLSGLKQNLKIMKKSRIFNFTGSIQYFIGSIQVPNSQNFFFESISFRKKKPRLNPSSERRATSFERPSQMCTYFNWILGFMESTSRADPHIASCYQRSPVFDGETGKFPKPETFQLELECFTACSGVSLLDLRNQCGCFKALAT